MKFKKLLQLASLGFLLYLAFDAFMYIEIAVTKNNHLIAFQKAEVDSIQNSDTLKQKTKGYLDTIRRVHRDNSNKSLTIFFILVGLIIIQAFLFLNRPTKSKIRISAVTLTNRLKKIK